jgi:predicted dehydrogenase
MGINPAVTPPGANGRPLLRVAVVGCQIGARHVRAYQRLPGHYRVVALCDIDQARASALSAETGGIPVETDYNELLARHHPDIVNICTPPHLHGAQVHAALGAGAHVVCEKPLAGNLPEMDRLMAAARAAGRLIVPIFQSRYGHGFQKLLRLINAGATGRCYLTTIETAWKRGPEYYAVPWRRTWQESLGGCLLGHAIHALDLLSLAVGRACHVAAFTQTLVNPIETEDCVSAALHMADGSLATVAVTLGSARELSRLRFCFERLVAESNVDPYNFSSEPWVFAGATPAVDMEIEKILRDYPYGPEGYEAQFLHTHSAFTGLAAPPITMTEARAVLELATALYTSARSLTIVTLPLPSRHPASHELVKP